MEGKRQVAASLLVLFVAVCFSCQGSLQEKVQPDTESTAGQADSADEASAEYVEDAPTLPNDISSQSDVPSDIWASDTNSNRQISQTDTNSPGQNIAGTNNGDTEQPDDSGSDDNVRRPQLGDLGITGVDSDSNGDNSDPGGGSNSPPDGWRSDLYPADWSPGHTNGSGQFLHDFSYAGYHHSETAVPSNRPSKRYNVVDDFGADSSGSSDATQKIQNAIDAAEQNGGGIVYFPAGKYRVQGRLNVRSSNIVLKGAGPEKSRLFFTKTEQMTRKSHLVFRGNIQHSGEKRLVEDAENRTKSIRVSAVNGGTNLSAGDDIAIGWVITDEFVKAHGMEGTWEVFNGEWQPIFRREITSIHRTGNTARVEFKVPLRYPALMRDKASIRRETGYIEEVGFEDLGIGNAVDWGAAWDLDGVHALEFRGLKDGWIKRVESFNPPSADGQWLTGTGSDAHLQSGGLIIRDSKRVTVSDTVMEKAQNRGSGGNGYLFEVRKSNEILFEDSVGRSGRHNFVQNWGFGVSGCVWHNVRSNGGQIWTSRVGVAKRTAHSEFHHSLSMGNLIDSVHVEDGWSAVNRQSMSSGAGHTATQSVFWNVTGSGKVRSLQYGTGYVIGTSPDIDVVTKVRNWWGIPGKYAFWEGTEPRDFEEGLGEAGDLVPQSLFDSQLAKRLN